MRLHRGHDRTQHRDRDGRLRLGDIDRLEAPGERRVLFEILAILGIGGRRDRPQPPPRQRRLQQIGGIPRPRLSARTDQRMRLVDEEDDGRGRALDFVDDLAKALFRTRPSRPRPPASASRPARGPRHGAAQAARRHRRCGVQNPRRRRSCRPPPRRSGSDCSADGAAKRRPVAGSRRRARRSRRFLPPAPWRSGPPNSAPAPRRWRPAPGRAVRGSSGLGRCAQDCRELGPQPLDLHLAPFVAGGEQGVCAASACATCHRSGDRSEPSPPRTAARHRATPSRSPPRPAARSRKSPRRRAAICRESRPHRAPASPRPAEGPPDRRHVALRVLHHQVDPVNQLDIRVAPHPGKAGGGFNRCQCSRVQSPEQ